MPSARVIYDHLSTSLSRIRLIWRGSADQIDQGSGIVRSGFTNI
jgi:hypothetical protein